MGTDGLCVSSRIRHLNKSFSKPCFDTVAAAMSHTFWVCMLSVACKAIFAHPQKWKVFSNPGESFVLCRGHVAYHLGMHAVCGVQSDLRTCPKVGCVLEPWGKFCSCSFLCTGWSASDTISAEDG